MCGIVSAFNFSKSKKKEKPEDVNKWIIDQLEDQISRGKEGFGTLFIDEKNNVKIERSTELTKTMLDLYMNKSKMIVLHHRMPSSSKNKLSQTHPIIVDNGSLKHKYYVIHNGVIQNAEELKKEHEKLGFIYSTSIKTEWANEIGFNDSESLAIELSRYIENQTKSININGSLAFIVVQVNKKTNKATQIFYGRNDLNPLKMSGSKGKIRLSSEGEGILTKENTIYNFDLKNFKINKKKLTITKSVTDYYYKPPKTEPNFQNYNENPYDYKEKDTPTLQEEIETFDTIEELTSNAIDETGSFITEFFDKIKDPDELFNIDIDKEAQELARKTIIIAMECHKKCQDAYTNNLIDKAKKDQKLI